MKEFKDNPIVQGYIKSNNFGKLLEMNLEIIDPGLIIYKMPITDNHLATPVAAHGGSICALMDASMGVCALSQVINDMRVVSTIEMKISFVAPAIRGDVLTAKASIVKSGKRLLFVEGEITNQKDKIIAIATGTFNSYPYEKVGFD
jgi:uncharacterized protein (TIGR00369 family)